MMVSKAKRNRQSLRLPCFDYSSPGFYFITICIKNREHLFGTISNGVMLSNAFGEVAEGIWTEIDQNYPQAKTGAFIVMPNHVHGIIEIKQPLVGAIHELHLRNEESVLDPNQRRKMQIPLIVGRYKVQVSKQINLLRKTPGASVWQRNYYEHIIRNEESLHCIREYIALNPSLWEKDRFNSAH